MNLYKKIANDNHEEIGALTSRHVSRHGLSKGARVRKKLVNRAAKRLEARIAFRDDAV